MEIFIRANRNLSVCTLELCLLAIINIFWVSKNLDLLLLFTSGNRVDELQDLHLGDALGALVAY